jgi:hypothetical protein
MVATRCTAWVCARLEKVPRVQIGIVDGFERCLEYELGCGQCLAYGLGMWTAWKRTSCLDWDGGWIGKPRVRFELWSVLSVQNGTVHGLERYLVYKLGLWLLWKGVQSTVWLMIVSVIESRV